MRFFINCSNLTSGGGLTVGLGVVTSLLKLNTDYFIVFIPNTNEYSKFEDTKNVRFIRSNSFFIFQKIFLEYKLAKYCRRHSCNAVLSLSNYALPIDLPQSLLLHWPYAVYPEKEFWDKMSTLNRLKRKVRLLKMKFLLKFTSSLIVQTNVMKERAILNLRYSKKINVIPSASGFLVDEINNEVKQRIDGLKNISSKVFLCINEYYEHKNLEVLIPVAQQVIKNGLNFSFIITLEQNDKSKPFLSLINKLGLQNIIVNVGRVKRSETKNIYKSVDALFFPSLIESFGIPLVEAQETGLPIYTSDRDFAHIVCGDNAIYFDPKDPSNIVDMLNKPSIENNNCYINTWNEITNQMLNTLR